MMIEIEKDIPIPEKRYMGRAAKYPFKDMHVGDSFAVPNIGKNLTTSVGTSARRWAKRNAPEAEFTVRVDKGKNEIRCWRFA